MEITRKSKILDVLKEYPDLEDVIIGMAPPFKNLRNPVLRKTVAQMATLEMVARVGGIDVVELVNTLRHAAGQGELQEGLSRTINVEQTVATGDPDWIAGGPQYVVDGVEMLRSGEVPLMRVNELLRTLAPDRYLLLITDFEPTPLLEAMRKKKRQCYSKLNPVNSKEHLTFIK